MVRAEDRDGVSESKRSLRASVLAIRSSLASAENEASSAAIWGRLQGLSLWKDARAIHTYIGSLPGEVKTDALITWALKNGRTVAVPVVDRKTRELRHVRLETVETLERTSWGGLEPSEGTPVDPRLYHLVIVPGVAFDRAGHRLGMGGGYYDRFLAEVRLPTIGLAHRFQIVHSVPVDERDVRVSIIVTPDEVIIPERQAPNRR